MKTTATTTKVLIAATTGLFAWLWVTLFIILFSGNMNAFNGGDKNLKTSSVPMFRLMMTGPLNSLDETVVYYQAGATSGFDAEFDAYKSAGANPAPMIAQFQDSVMMQINGVEPVAQSFSISIKATTNVTGTFTLSASDFMDLPKGTCVFIQDIYTGITQNIINVPYTFLLSDTTHANRFVLSVIFNQVPFTSSYQAPSCGSGNDGKLVAAANGPGLFDYFWLDSTGFVVKYTYNRSGADSLTGLQAGNYTVEIEPSLGCGYNSATFTIDAVVKPSVFFVLPDTILLGTYLNTQNTNQSVNAVTYQWNFGNGQGTSGQFEPSYLYSAPGDYTVSLTGISSTGCADTSYQTIHVSGFATAVKETAQQNIRLLTFNDNQYVIDMQSVFMKNTELTVFNLSGQQLAVYTATDFSNNQLKLDLGNYSKGLYLVNITGGGKTIGYFKLPVK